MDFKNLKISKEILEGIEYFGYTQMTDIQTHTIPKILEQKDILACSQTGSGKTAAFVIPLLELISKTKSKSLKALIICPTRELCQQIEEQITGLAYLTNITSCAIYGGAENLLNFENQKNAISKSNTDIIVATPGRLLSHLKLGYANLKDLKHFILDEADEMLNMGFYKDILNIISYLPENRHNMMFSATMPKEIKQLADKILKKPEIIDLNKSKPANQIKQYKYYVEEKEKYNLLYKTIKAVNSDRVIVFTSTKSKVIEINKFLNKKNILSKGISSSFSQSERNEFIQKFKANNIQVLVATNLIARGIDITDIGIIVNFDIPDNPEDYVHRIGRTARAGKKGIAYSYISRKEKSLFIKIEKHLVKKIELLTNLGHSKENNKNSYRKRNKKRGK